jgi:ParB family chromosome partitioning protein
MTTYTNITTRDVPIDSLVIDARFAGLFIEEPDTIARITRDMKRNGFDRHRPIDVWKDGAGRGRHVVLEGHQRLAAAKAAGLETVRIAYRQFDNPNRALLWAAEQQTNRRNASREAQCLSILRALKRAGQLHDTRAGLSERFGFGDATVGRAMQVLNRGTESEITAVLEGAHSLKRAYELILQRERAEDQAVEDDDPRGSRDRDQDLDHDLDGDNEEPETDVIPELGALRAALDVTVEALDQAIEFFTQSERNVFGATADHRESLIEDVGNAARDAESTWARLEGRLTATEKARS